MSATYIYFVQAGGGPIKIGISRNPTQRLVKMAADNHLDLKLLAVMQGDIRIERELHELFSAENMRGEWFNPAPALLDYIHSHAQPPEYCGFAGLTPSQDGLLRAIESGTWHTWESPTKNCIFVACANKLIKRGLVEHNKAGMATHRHGDPYPAWVYRLTHAGQSAFDALRLSA